MTERKPFSASPPKPPKVLAPISPRDDKRTFDARPKPTDDWRRRDDPRYRTPQHEEPKLDDPEAGGEKEE